MKTKQSVGELVLEGYIEGLKDGRNSGNNHIRIKDLRKGDKATYEVEQLKTNAEKMIAQAKQEERDTLKAQVRKEIEELMIDPRTVVVGNIHFIGGKNQALTDCLSIPSLKEEE